MRKRRITTGALVLLCALTGIHCGSGGGGGSPTAPPSRITISVTENAFSPRSVTISVGDTVVWVFEGADPTHTTTAIQGTWDSTMIFLAQGDTFERVFTEAGQTFEYSCTTHQGCCAMQGSIRVGQNAPAPRDGY